MPRQTKPWTVLFYLCGDNPHGGLDADIRADLQEILAAGGSDRVHVAVQYDGPRGGGRWLATTPWAGEAGTLPPPDVDLGRHVDSGSADMLSDYLKWALATCPCEHIALVITGTGILDERSVVGIPLQEPDRVFAICDDRPERSAIEIRDLGRVLLALKERRGTLRPVVDLLAFDMCHMQFLEVACELNGLVEILVGPQTRVPGSGWDYRAMLDVWHRLLEPLPDKVAARRSALRRIAAETVAEIGRAYAAAGATEASVSALDLAQLNPFLGAFDTMSLAYLQCLSDRILWSARGEGLSRLGALRDESSYDAREILRQVAAALGSSDVDTKVLAYGLDTLRELDPRALLRVLSALETLAADVLTGSSARLTAQGILVLAAYERLHTWLIESTAALRTVASRQDAGELAGTAFRAAWTEAVERRADALAQAAGFADARALAPPTAGGSPTGEAAPLPDVTMRLAGGTLDEPFVAAWIALIDRYRQSRHGPDGVAVAFAALLAERRNALRVHDLVWRIADLLERAGPEAGGLVVSVAPATTPYGGMSLYRPRQLGELTRDSYLALQMNQRLHWTALLTAIHLIEDHPRQLWRVLGSLLATARQRGRQDLLARMAGPQALVSVGDQFRALTPAPLVTLALEVETARDLVTPARRSGDRPASPDQDVYVARLSSSRRDAVIHEQRSRLDRAVVAQVIGELEEAAAAGTLETVALQLDKLGHLLREDIVRDLTEPLEAERAAARETLHVQLQLPRSLLHYPWELVRDGDEWLGTRYALARQVFLDVAVTARRRAISRPDRQRLRVLVVGDPRLDEERASVPPLGFARSEAVAVQEILQSLAHETDYIEIDPESIRAGERVTVADMRGWLRSGRYDVIHFCGHAHFNRNEPERSHWLLSDGPLAAEQIANTLDHCDSPPWLVYVNACEGGMERDQAAGFLQSVTGLASAFLNRGVTAYLAPLWKIDDAAALELARAFYQSLVLDRTTVGEALRLARRQVRQAHPGSPTWAGMTLYGDSTATVMQRVGALISGEDG